MTALALRWKRESAPAHNPAESGRQGSATVRPPHAAEFRFSRSRTAAKSASGEQFSSIWRAVSWSRRMQADLSV